MLSKVCSSGMAAALLRKRCRAVDAEHLSFNTSLTSQQTDAAAFAFMLLWRHVS